MRTELTSYAAYHGAGWKPRARSLERELDDAAAAPWSSFFRVDSEFARLRAVTLALPGPELDGDADPNRVQHLARIDRRRLARELRALARSYTALGIRVELLDRRAFAGEPGANLFFTRDLFFNSRAGAVVARMGSRVRAGEEKYAAATLAKLGVPIGRTIGGSGLFEGADALWLDRRTVLCGIGARTNRAGAAQLAAQLALAGVRVRAIKLPAGTQHLLGILQLVDRDLALVRDELAPVALKRELARRGIRVVRVPEIDEVKRLQGMNVVTVAPRAIVMPDDCPRLRELYRRAGLRIAAAVGISELRKGAGGIACATGILARDLRARGAEPKR